MKRLLLILGLAALVACGARGGREGENGGYKYESQGAQYELVVVADHPEWSGPVGDTLRAVLAARFPMVNREETMFTLLRVLPEGFTKFVPRHRNILIVNVNPEATEATLGMAADRWARPQVVLTATAPNETAMLELLGERLDDIVLVLEAAEKDRDVADAQGHTPAAIAELVKAKFGIEMGTGPAYTVRDDSEGFLWMSYELPRSSQGIVIYTYPFSGSTDLSEEALLARRDEFAARIPGENPGSHMATDREYTELVYKKINGRQWAELHGFWNVRGDFMGGPYTNYSTVVAGPDGSPSHVLAIDLYVYSPDPRLSQRNYIRQLEHYVHTVKF